jgi:hypothetical protein
MSLCCIKNKGIAWCQYYRKYFKRSDCFMRIKRGAAILSKLILISLLSGCYVEPPFAPNFPVGEIEGYKPLYASSDQAAITFTSPRQLVNPGKIYVVSNYLLINERYEGIHVYDNSNPSAPISLGFLQIAGNTEIAVKNNILYVDHLTDLVALKVSDWNNPEELSRLKQEAWRQEVPPGNGRYFECVDRSKGVVVGWELVILKDPKCFR